MNYWLVRAKWDGEDKKAEFINNDEWINGYNNKFLTVVNRVRIDDILLLADGSTITHYGKCIENSNDGKHLLLERWIKIKKPVNFPAKGAYIKTIQMVNNSDLIKEAESAIEQTVSSHNIKIDHIEIKDFTIFRNEQLTFSKGLNIIIGENGTGKSHLLRLLYALVESNNAVSQSETNDQVDRIKQLLRVAIPDKLQNIFRPDALNNLIHEQSERSHIDINLKKYSIEFDFAQDTTFETNIKGEDLPKELFEKSTVFIPAKEVLSFYEGFTALYEKREISFDETYYRLVQLLGLLPLKNIDSYPDENRILNSLEEILEGKILLERGRFYLVSDDGKKREVPLVAEGLRKIGAIAHLIANGSLNRHSVLFWDEPESNLNPKVIKKVAKCLMELSASGMQIFIATHSLFLIKEIEILRKEDSEVQYTGLGLNENYVTISQNKDFEYLEDQVLLDEEFLQSDRFSAKEE